jgi:hypothetical protein
MDVNEIMGIKLSHLHLKLMGLVGYVPSLG